MSDVCRLWLVVCGDDDARLERTIEILAAASIVTVVSSGERECESIAARIRTALAVRTERDERLRCQGSTSTSAIARDGLDALDAWAHKHAGEQIAVLCDRSLALRAVASALALDIDDHERFELGPATAIALDWPARGAPHARPSLAGFALDWAPHWNPNAPHRFPGGPGSAVSSRP